MLTTGTACYTPWMGLNKNSLEAVLMVFSISETSTPTPFMIITDLARAPLRLAL
jgi:hypothetical protein